MIQIKRFFAVAAVLIAGIQLGTAQDTGSRICHVASQELVEAMPEAIAADKQLRGLAKSYQDRMAEMDKEIQTMLQKAQNEAPNKTDEQNEAVKNQLIEAQQKLEQYVQNSQQAMAQKKTDLLKPLYNKVREAIFKVAKAKNFNYVMDSTTGTGLIMAEGYDLTPDVKAELGIK